MMAVNPLFGLVYLVAADTIRRAVPMPPWAPVVLGVMCFANLGFAIGTWRFKKWGVYGFVAMSAIGLVLNLGIGNASPGSILGGLLGPVLLVALVRPVWRDFD
jgi:hypothetical protein